MTEREREGGKGGSEMRKAKMGWGVVRVRRVRDGESGEQRGAHA